MTFKWFAMNVGGEELVFIVPKDFDVISAAMGKTSQDDLADAVVAQAQNEEWAAKIVDALNKQGVE